jgi:SAM-dependent methyltransferase
MSVKKWKNHSGIVKSSKNNYSIIDCEICQFAHIVPIPSEDDIVDMYSEDYYDFEKPDYIDLVNKDKEWWDLSYDNRYDSFEDILGKKQRRLLDIGSGPGLFLLRGKNRGWHVTGIEPAKTPYLYSSKTLGLNIKNIFFDSHTYKDIEKFDVINLSLVMEHIPHPPDFLKLVYDRIETGGLISIELPNDYNPFQIATQDSLGYEPWWVAPPHHINYFNFNSLERLLQESGFKVVLKEATFPIDLFLLMEENYIGNNKLGRKCHELRKNFELNLHKSGNDQLKRQLYKKLAELNLGREIIMIGQK